LDRGFARKLLISIHGGNDLLVSKDGTTTYSSTPARELAKVEARLLKLLPATGTPSEAMAAEIGRLSRLHDVWRAEADKETVARWEFHQRGLAVHRRIAAEHQDALKKLGRTPRR